MPLVNGKRKNQISIYDRGFMYGDSVFETILVKDYKPQYLNEHLSRLSKGCKFLEININKYNYLERDIKKIIKNKKNCILNIIVTRGIGYGCDNEAKRLVKLLRYSNPNNRRIRVTTYKKIVITFKLPKKNNGIKINYTITK